MDALKFSNRNSKSQFKLENVLRELNKAFIAFTKVDDCKHSTISTGKWGCGAFKGDL